MSIHLEIIQGPSAGEKLTYQPGSTIRIGRVVRGNNLTIKDSGISSKHLLIQHNSQDNKWVVQDLDSSNGTTLNSSAKLIPFEPLDLRDGDVIKLGELTSIRVSAISENMGNGGVQVQRSTRSQVAKNKDKSELDGGVVEISVENARKGRRGKARVSEESVSVGRRSTRSKKAQDEEGKSVEERAAVRGRGRPRKARVLEEIPENETIPERFSNVDEKTAVEPMNLRNNDSNFPNAENENVEKGGLKFVEVKKEVEECEEAVNTSGDGDLQVGECVEEKQEFDLDLERMTLGELFDYLELALPREIKEASERYIEEIRKKAARFEEYTMQAKETSLV